MEKFTVNILGCGSALPTLRHNPSAQVLTLGNRLFLIDCGEGTQKELRRHKIALVRINHIFISHHHGDHCFGLPGLLSTLGLLGRRGELHIYGPAPVGVMVQHFLELFGEGIAYEVTFHVVDTTQSQLVYASNALEVHSVPLRHRIPCCGYVFREKPHLRHIRRDMIDFYGIPNYALNNIKAGADWETEAGEVIANERLTLPADPSRSYAYCSDTQYLSNPPSCLQQVDLLYHEATFADDEKELAQKVGHSTARQAALTAQKLRAGQLLLGHYSSRYTDETILLREAQAIFSATMLAAEGDVFKVERPAK